MRITTDYTVRFPYHAVADEDGNRPRSNGVELDGRSADEFCGTVQRISGSFIFKITVRQNMSADVEKF